MVTVSNYASKGSDRKARSQSYAPDLDFLDSYDSDDSYHKQSWQPARHYMGQRAVYGSVGDVDEGIDRNDLWIKSADGSILLTSSVCLLWLFYHSPLYLGAVAFVVWYSWDKFRAFYQSISVAYTQERKPLFLQRKPSQDSLPAAAGDVMNAEDLSEGKEIQEDENALTGTTPARMSRTYAPPRPEHVYQSGLDQFDPELEPRRLWSDRARIAIPYFFERVLDFIQSYFLFQVGFQFCITIAQTLGVHFVEGRDSFGFFPRYFENFFSANVMLGVGWLDFVKSRLLFYPQLLMRFITTIWDLLKLLFLVARSFAIESQAIPGEKVAADYWRQSAPIVGDAVSMKQE